MKQIKYKVLIASLVIVYLTVFIGSTFTSQSVDSTWYDSIKPSITPPNYIFPIVWNILFLLISLSIYFSWISAKNASTKKSIAILFGINLFFNMFWSFAFFSQQNPQGAFAILIALWLSILSLLILTWRINKTSTYLLVPYLVWVTFAGVLNGIIAF